MSMKLWAVCILLVGACADKAAETSATSKAPMTDNEKSASDLPKSTATTASGAPIVAKVAMFNEVSIENGSIMMMDGGTHGVQGHTLTIPAKGEATWQRRLDSLRPHGTEGSGQLALTAEEEAQVQTWAGDLWKLAPEGEARFDPPVADGPPRWVWGIVLRRGDEVRVLSGGGLSSTATAPKPATAALAWLASRVDAAAANAVP